MESTNELKVGDIINVYGWIMMQKMEGRLKVSKVDDFSYWFTKPRGKKTIVRHYINSVDLWVKEKGHGNLNRIEVEE